MNNKPQLRERKDTLKAQNVLQYLLAVMVYAAAVAGIGLLFWNVCTSRIWQGTELLYPLLHWLKAHIFSVYFFLCLVGSIVLAYCFLAKPYQYLDAVVMASKKLANLSEEPIELPTAMRSVEDELNLFREQALRNAMLAKEAEQRKNDLIVYLAHDLKTPLTSVIGYLTLLKDEPQISAHLQERYTKVALDKAERLEELINEFFDITRFNLTTLTLEPELLNLSRMLEQITSEFEPILEEKQLHWKLQIEPDVKIQCDADKIQRVFDNLIRNAVNYSYAGTEIFLSMSASEQTAYIYVRNQGRTIPPEKLCHIFEQFFRIDSSRASATGGAGLGLAIAKEIVELHGGTIQAKSANEHIIFTVELPVG